MGPPCGGDENASAPTSKLRRRAVLASLGGGGSLALAAAVTSLGDDDSDGFPVSILAAGSLQRTLGEGLRAAVDVPIRVEAHGSVTVAHLVANGQRDPDLVVLADVALFDSLLDAPWHATVATNELVLAHTGRAEPHPLADASHWFRPILDGDVSLGRTDPTLDPLGYRTVFAFDLAASRYNRPGLREDLLATSSIYPETSLVSRLETGTVDAAVLYRNMAIERVYPTVDLPASIDLSDPERDYSDAQYRLADGTVLSGAPIRYGAWARSDDERVRRVFTTLADGSVFDSHGFGTAPPLPLAHGDVPDGFQVWE